MLKGLGNVVEHRLQLGLEQRLKLRAAFNADAQCPLPQLVDHNIGCGRSNVCGQQQGPQALQRRLVNLTRQRQRSARSTPKATRGSA